MPEIITSLSDLSSIRAGADAVVDQLKNTGPILMMLGPFMFAMGTAAYQRLNRATEYRWPSQPRIGRLPSLQYVGPGAETVDLEGVIYPEFAGGTSQVQAMRELAGLGKPMILVDGLGAIYDEWVILRIEETQTVFKNDSSPKKVEFRLSLARYGKDKPEEVS